MLIEIRKYFLFLPNVISRREHVNAAGKKLLRALDVNPHPARGILRVGDRKVDILSLNNRRNEVAHRASRRTPHHIPKDQYSHSSSVRSMLVALGTRHDSRTRTRPFSYFA